MKSWLVLFLTLTLSSGNVLADRIKDLTSVAAMRTNQLIGYGLVVGLNGSGDGADVSFTAQSMKTLLNRLGVSLEGPLSDFETASSSGKIDIKNTAAVMVTAELPGFAKPGQKIDVTVSAIGKAWQFSSHHDGRGIFNVNLARARSCFKVRQWAF